MAGRKKRGKKRWIFRSFCIVVAALIVVCGVYLGTYYHADTDALASYQTEQPVQVEMLADGNLVYTPKQPKAGLIFYPGGKVEHTAYEPLMKELASEAGILCILVKMPFRLAVFDMDAAEGLQEQYPEISDWYIGGHSLGGSMAASYVADHAADYEGLILFASYSTADLSQTSLSALCLYGSEDQVLNWENYEKYRENLPGLLEEQSIPGGNHAQFGMYGAQKGDGKATITGEAQIQMAAELIAGYMELD